MRLPRCLLIPLAFVVASLSAKDVQVRGYTRKDGTYVAPHVRTSPNSTKADNYSTKGNVNPNTGKEGTKAAAPTTLGAQQKNQPPSATGATTTLAKSEAAKPETVNLSLVTVGMSKPQVIAAVGKPNLETQSSWFYIDRGFVRFKEEKVASIEAR